MSQNSWKSNRAAYYFWLSLVSGLIIVIAGLLHVITNDSLSFGVASFFTILMLYSILNYLLLGALEIQINEELKRLHVSKVEGEDVSVTLNSQGELYRLDYDDDRYFPKAISRNNNYTISFSRFSVNISLISLAFLRGDGTRNIHIVCERIRNINHLTIYKHT